MKEDEKLLNIKQASKILGVKVGTLYQWHWLRIHLPFVKVGKSLRISERDLVDFIEKRKRKPEEG